MEQKTYVSPAPVAGALACRLLLGRIAQRPQLAAADGLRYRERVAAKHVDVLVDERRQPRHVGVLDRVAFPTQLGKCGIQVEVFHSTTVFSTSPSAPS